MIARAINGPGDPAYGSTIDDDSVDRLANSVAPLTTAPQLPETMTPTRATQRLIDTRLAIGNRRSILRQSNRMG
jgi:hypothetical protein